MRVITGTKRGRRLKTPMGESIRPTGERVKEAVFSMLHYDLPGSVFADFYSGTGQMGIEALSRGAARCIFVDGSRQGFGLTKENVSDCGLLSQSQLVNSDVSQYLRHTSEQFDLVYADPPYEKGLLEEMLPLLEGRVRPKGRVLIETRREETLPEEVGSLVKTKETRYGIAKITVYEKSKLPQGEEESK